MRPLLLLLVLALTPALARAQEVCPNSTDLTECLNFRVKKVVGAKTEQNGNTKQTETPSVSENSTSLVDESSAPDLVSMALNLSGLSATSQGDDKEADSLSVTATAYALYARFKGFDPLNPHYYNKYRDWRRFSFTLGYDNEDKPGGASGEKQRVKLLGAKYLVINRRDPNRGEFMKRGGVYDNLFNQTAAATTSFGTVINRTRALLFHSPDVVTNIVVPEFNTYLDNVKREAESGTDADAARRIAAAAREASSAPAAKSDDPAANAEAVRAAVNAAANRESPVGVSRRVRAAVVDVANAADAAGQDAVRFAKREAGESADRGRKATQEVAPKMVAAAEAAADKVRDNDAAVVARTDALRGQLSMNGLGPLFEFGPDGLEIRTGSRRWTEEELEYYTLFQNRYATGAGFDRLRGMIDDGMMAQIDGFIEAELKSFTNLDKASLKAIQAIRNAPQLSVAFFTKQRGVGADEHKGEVTFDYGMGDRLNLSLNGAFVYSDSKTIGGDTRVGDFGAKLKWQLNRNKLRDLLNDRRPIFFDLAANGKWGNGVNSVLKAQAKLTIPIGAGFELPLSLTVANRTELVDEKEVRGQFGFTFDFSKLIKSLAASAVTR
jgi:hypothetical protein